VNELTARHHRPQAFLDENIGNLGDLTKLVRGQLSGLQRKIIAALITVGGLVSLSLSL
jgi:hypothetical protein